MRSVLIFHTKTAVSKQDNIFVGFMQWSDKTGGGKIVFVVGITLLETKTGTLNDI